jgi:putative MFS transporter
MYLNQTGKSEKAREVIQRMARGNGNNAEIGHLKPEEQKQKSAFALFSPKLRRRSILLLAAWFTISISYYGVFVYLPIRLSADGYGFMRGQYFLILIALVQIPGFALAAYGVERWGRKPTLVGFLVLSAIGCLIYSVGTSGVIVVGVTLLMSFALLGTWAGVYAFTPEVYPTRLRASGMGAAGAMARAGGLLAPSVVAPLMTTNFTLALGAISAFLILAALCVNAMDVETKGRPLE